MPFHHFLARCVFGFALVAVAFCPQVAWAGGIQQGSASVAGQVDDGLLAATGVVRGVGRMGYGSAPVATPPPSAHGSSPNDYRRGYEGSNPNQGDSWNRDADFKARNYMLRHGPAPENASPPAVSTQPVQPPQLKFPFVDDKTYTPIKPTE